MTLRDAGEYITELPKATQRKPEWELATELLLGALGSIVMLAHIALMQALLGKKVATRRGHTGHGIVNNHRSAFGIHR